MKTSKYAYLWTTGAKVTMPVNDVWLTPHPFTESRYWRASSSAVVMIISVMSKLFIRYCNKPQVYNRQKLINCILHRPSNKGLITVCNHYSMVDDALLAYMLPWAQILHRPSMRWLLGAKDVCFTNYRNSLFFQLGRVLPVVRGEGVYQKSMDFCTDRLNRGEWVSIYPEGKVNISKDFLRLKWGVGRLVSDSKVTPIVVPYWHMGMEDMLPTKKPYIPQLGKNITVVIGNPLDFEKDLQIMKEQQKTREELRRFVTDKIQEVFATLKSETEAKHREGLSAHTAKELSGSQ